MPATATAIRPTATKRIPTRDLEQLLRQQSAAAAGRNPLEPISPAEVPPDKDGTSIIRLDVFQVQPFKGNPRTASNDKRQEIRESIRAAGLQQKIHVCKHPVDGYITARSGCTRLGELHALASEKDAQGRPSEDARRFQKIDFIPVPYTRDSDLLVCHLSENLQRSDMSFWDTAAGVLNTCGQLEKELGREIGVRELEELLKARGLSVNYTALIDYVFALENLSLLPASLRHRVTRNDIRQLLRPAQRLLGEFWQQHGGKGPEEFLHAYRSSVALVQESEELTIERLHASIRDAIAMKLGYEARQFQSLIDAYKLDKQAPLADLLDPPVQRPLGGTGLSSECAAAASEHGKGLETQDEDGGDLEADSGNPANSSNTADEAGDRSLDGRGAGANPTGPTGPVSAGAGAHPGLQVVSKKDALQAARADLAVQAQSTQAEFDGMHPVEVAQAHLQVQLHELCQLVGVQDYLKQSAAMLAGFYMDLPKPA